MRLDGPAFACLEGTGEVDAEVARNVTIRHAGTSAGVSTRRRSAFKA
jgi:hypothetical protein